MSIATLFAGQVFVGGGLYRTARWFLTANGLLVPFIALQMYFHPLIWIAALWAVTFPGSTWTLAVLFKRSVVPHDDEDRLGDGRAGQGRHPPRLLGPETC